jgi:hypothetical protein
MASEVTTESDKSPKLNSQLMYSVVVGITVGVFLQAAILKLIHYRGTYGDLFGVIGLFLGAAIGGAICLLRQGRSAEMAKYLGQGLVGLLVTIPIFAAGRFGHKLHGEVGRLVGLLGSTVLIFGVLYLSGKLLKRKPTT